MGGACSRQLPPHFLHSVCPLNFNRREDPGLSSASSSRPRPRTRHPPHRLVRCPTTPRMNPMARSLRRRYRAPRPDLPPPRQPHFPPTLAATCTSSPQSCARSSSAFPRPHSTGRVRPRSTLVAPLRWLPPLTSHPPRPASRGFP